MAKEALTREVGSHSDIPYVKRTGRRITGADQQDWNRTGRTWGSTTALAVNVNTYPTHIAGLPVAVNICCHVNRHVIRTI